MNRKRIFLIILALLLAVAVFFFLYRGKHSGLDRFVKADIERLYDTSVTWSPVVVITTLSGEVQSSKEMGGKLIVGESQTNVLRNKFLLDTIIPGTYPVIYVDDNDVVHKVNPGYISVYPGINNYDFEVEE